MNLFKKNGGFNRVNAKNIRNQAKTENKNAILWLNSLEDDSPYKKYCLNVLINIDKRL